MSDTLLPYYDRELTAIHRLATEFAEAYPKIAGRLRLSPGGVDDPHVARLLDGVAFLAARVHHRLDDEFPELTDALLGLLHIRIIFPRYRPAWWRGWTARRTCNCRTHGRSALSSKPNRCVARRCATGPPRRLRCGRLKLKTFASPASPIVAPANPAATGAVAALRITLKCAVPEMTFAQLEVDRLRFFLQGPSNQTLPLYELLGGHVLSVAFADSAVDANQVHRASHLQCNRRVSATTRLYCRGRRAVLPDFAC